MATHMEIVLRAAAFAAEKHRNQRRKDAEAFEAKVKLAHDEVKKRVDDASSKLAATTSVPRRRSAASPRPSLATSERPSSGLERRI